MNEHKAVRLESTAEPPVKPESPGAKAQRPEAKCIPTRMHERLEGA